jgi:hypothetical protein
MPRYSVFATGVSLIAFSTLAFAGPDNATNDGSAFSRTASENGLKSAPSISARPSAGVVTPSAGEPLALAAPTDVDAVPILKHIASTGAQLLDLGATHERDGARSDVCDGVQLSERGGVRRRLCVWRIPDDQLDLHRGHQRRRGL